MGRSNPTESESSERLELRGRLLIGQMWDPVRDAQSPVRFEFSNDESPLHGTIKGGPILFGTFLAVWLSEGLRIRWSCAHHGGVTEGETLVDVTELPGCRLMMKPLREKGKYAPTDFLCLEEPMRDTP